jgi:hypothetical protein
VGVFDFANFCSDYAHFVYDLDELNVSIVSVLTPLLIALSINDALFIYFDYFSNYFYFVYVSITFLLLS